MRRPAILDRLLRDESGTATVEAVITFPILAWVLLATAVFFQAFHADSLNVKVTYTLGDILSREDRPITPEYLDSMFALQGEMTGSGEPRTLRVTAVTFEAGTGGAAGRYRVVWSQVRGTFASPHTDATLAAIAATRLPVMSEGQVAILTETWLRHTPAFIGVGLSPLTFYEITATRPRVPQFCWNSSNDPTAWTQVNTVCSL